MWIFTSNAFLSIVAHRDNTDMRLVRARSPGDIEVVFPEAEVFEDKNADYQYRAIIPADDVASVLARQVLEMDYDNFKNSIPAAKQDYHDACLHVWHTMYGLQKKEKYFAE